VIEIQHVSKNYGDRLVVDNVSLKIETGGMTSIIGSNGAGKSTLLALMSRLIKPDSGSIHIAGHNIVTTQSHVLVDLAAILTPKGD